MKKLVFLLISLSALVGSELEEVSLDKYLTNFDMQERSDMKIKSVEMLHMIEEGSAV